MIRNTAAQQLADVQKQHPDELFNLLTRVVPYLRSRSWDTRVAASKAIGGIVDNAPLFDPNADDVSPESGSDAASPSNGVKKEDPDMKQEDVPPMSDDQLQLGNLDVTLIMTYGKKLLGSAGKEYDYKLAAMDPTDRLAHQKKTLTARLGLGGEYIEEELVTENDFSMPNVKSALPPPAAGMKIDTAVAGPDPAESPISAMSPRDSALQTPIQGTALSKRQINALKRKNKKDFKDQAKKVRVIDLGPRRQSSLDFPQTPTTAEPYPVKTEGKQEDGEAGGIAECFSLQRNSVDDDSKVVTEFKGVPVPDKSVIQTDAEEAGLEWPFERLCEFLSIDLFDASWEIRHGAAMALREVVRVHGAGSGRVHGKSRSENDKLNVQWLDDLACRLCCVFMLDRFGDYVSDTVVAPIRETAGQALGALLQHLPNDTVRAAYRILHKLVLQDGLNLKAKVWEACHGGMIGLRYLVAVRKDLLLKDDELLDGMLEAVMKGLGDNDDDVRSVSAATLVPVAQEVVSTRPSALNGLINIVWECLSNLSDDLSASTGSVMDLLAKLCSFPEVLNAMKKNAAEDSHHSFTELVPRLYPFLRHTITSVRSAVLRALLTFLEIEGGGMKGWVNGKALRLIFQNLIVERNDSVLRLSFQVWMTLLATYEKPSARSEALAEELGPHIEAIFSLTTSPIGVSRNPIPIDHSLFIKPSGQAYTAPFTAARATPPAPSNETSTKRRKRSEKKEKEAQPLVPTNSSHNIDAAVMQGDIDLIGADVMIRCRVYGAKALGKAIALWPSSSKVSTFSNKILSCLKSVYSSTQLISAIVVEEYARQSSKDKELVEDVLVILQNIVENDRPSWYSDLVSHLRIVHAQCMSLLNVFRDVSPWVSLPIVPVVVQGEPEASAYAFSITKAESLVGPDFEHLKKSLTPVQRTAGAQSLQDARSDAVRALDDAKAVKGERDMQVRAAAAAAIVAFGRVPKRPSSTIKAMMDSVKREENSDLQRRLARSVADLIEQMALAGKRAVVDKVVGNLVKFCCMETAETPEFHVNAGSEVGVLSLKKDEDIRDGADAAKFKKEARAARITRRGAKEALEQLVDRFRGVLFEKLPILRELIEAPIHRVFHTEALPEDIKNPDNTVGQEAVDALSTLRALSPKFSVELHQFARQLLPTIACALQSKLSVLRYAAAKCFATLCSVLVVDGITMLVEKVLPLINNPLDVHCRQGAIECIYHLIHVMEDGILPYVIFLIVPVLGRMSDSDHDVRLLATTTFATLVKLVPLEAGIPDPPGLSEALLHGRERERKFIAQMLDPKKVEPFELPVAIKAELRSYQQEGVNWLAFLNRYNLHGVLCDDMGLGKTLQTLCIVASDHHMRAKEFAKTQSPEVRRLPSLIVCPPTLSGHWQQEIAQYAPFLTSVAYVGPPSERSKRRAKLAAADVVITSYDICRNDVDVIVALNWNYCVLDEGHLIKNPKAKVTQAVKRLSSNHRLILSGTPIQNNVFELWSLFDFLMPGFLGTEKVFHDRFAKPIAASRFSKSSSKEQEAGALAIEALHKQVLPFLLRRLKEEVLNDLPPKIIQNYYCDLSELQRKLFDDFTKKESKSLSDKAASNDKEAKQHIFQALQYMRKLCNSPAMVMKEGHKHYDVTQRYLARQNSSLRDPAHAPKLGALHDLLVDCGIGVAVTENDIAASTTTDAVSPHRALIFCQMKEMLDMVQEQVLRKMLPTVQYLRLDGSVEASRRQEIVNRFNSDPSYDVLLLTTSVGGLGLNLTGADTVIFVEHDWNPQKDLQAMDRAHRIGQKKVVNVYRLVTRGTLEEKILK